MGRVTVAFLVAPLAPALCFGAVSGLAAGALYVAAWAYPSALVLGVPAYCFMRKRGWLKLWQVSIGSSALGLLSYALFFSVFEYSGSGAGRIVLFAAPVFTACALVTGITFWAIALRGQPRASAARAARS